MDFITPSNEWSVTGNQSIKLINNRTEDIYCRIKNEVVSEDDNITFKFHVLNRNNHKIYAQIIQVNSEGAQTQVILDIPHSENEQCIIISKDIDQPINYIFCQVSGINTNDIVFIDDLSLTISQ